MLGPKYVEYIHDELVTKLWPGADPIANGEYRSADLLESATARPFHSAFGQDAYPALIQKAGALFHSLIANHPFHNGNKRTAVLAFDLFLIANGYFCVLPNDKMYQLATKTASYRERGLSHEQSLREIRDALEGLVIPLEALRQEAKNDLQIGRLHKTVMKARRRIRHNKLNRLLE